MRNPRDFRWTVLFACAALAAIFLSAPRPLQACEVCYSPPLVPERGYCKAPDHGETGTTICKTLVSYQGTSTCEVSGNFCTVITVPGGGGGGGSAGGGGTSPCDTTGFCPAECFSCGGSGGGGRPAV